VAFLPEHLGAGDFLLFVEDKLFELGFAIVADVFVDGHSGFLWLNSHYISMPLEVLLWKVPHADSKEKGQP